MCICINCKHIRYCKTYQFIEDRHYHDDKNNKQNSANFTPINTIITVSINKKKEYVILDWDLRQCASFIEKPGHWLVQH